MGGEPLGPQHLLLLLPFPGSSAVRLHKQQGFVCPWCQAYRPTCRWATPSLLLSHAMSALKLLANKTALLTGASRGIGHELACRLSKEGAKVRHGSKHETQPKSHNQRREWPAPRVLQMPLSSLGWQHWFLPCCHFGAYISARTALLGHTAPPCSAARRERNMVASKQWRVVCIASPPPITHTRARALLAAAHPGGSPLAQEGPGPRK